MKHIFLIFLLPLFLIDREAAAQQYIILKGNVVGMPEGYNKLYFYGTTFTYDSALVTDNKFEFRVPFKKPGIILVCDEYSFKTNHDHPAWYRLITDEPGTLYLQDVDLRNGIKVAGISGSQAAVDFQELVKLEKETRKSRSDLIKQKYGDKRPARGTPGYDEFANFVDSIRIQSEIDLYSNFVRSHPDSYASTFALNSNGASVFHTDEGPGIYGMLSERQRKSEDGRKIAAFMEGIQKARLGRTVNDFTLQDISGKHVAFSQLKGKYVLLDFWASFCAPCIAEFPKMKEFYSQYKGDNFEIYTISIDKNKDAWIKMSKTLNLPWISTLDTKNISGGEFAVTGIPDAFLIDPDGKIIMKTSEDVTKDDFQKKLKEVLKVK